jgi:hypothetical protein
LRDVVQRIKREADVVLAAVVYATITPLFEVLMLCSRGEM